MIKEHIIQSPLLIEGCITDILGQATFSGSLDNENIMFTKRYSEDAKNRGAALDEVYYEGRFVLGEFRGEYKVMEGETRVRSTGTFTMQKI